MKPRHTPTSPKNEVAKGIEELYRSVPLIEKPRPSLVGLVVLSVIFSVLAALGSFVGLQVLSARFPNARLLQYFSKSGGGGERVIIREQPQNRSDQTSKIVQGAGQSVAALVKHRDAKSPFQQDDRLGLVSFLTTDGIGVTFSNNDLPSDARVLFPSGEQQPVKKIAKDQATSLTFIKVDATTNALPLVGVEDLSIGQDVWVMRDSPFSGGVGVVSAKIVTLRDRIPGQGGTLLESSEVIARRIRLDHSLDKTWDGAAVLDESKQLIGLVATTSDAAGALVLPVSSVRSQLVTFSHVGSFHRAVLGVSYYDLAYTPNLSPENRTGAHLASADQPRVPAIVKNSPASVAKLKEADILTEVNAIKLDEMHALSEVIATINPGTKITLKIHRGQTNLEIPVTLGDSSP